MTMGRADLDVLEGLQGGLGEAEVAREVEREGDGLTKGEGFLYADDEGKDDDDSDDDNNKDGGEIAEAGLSILAGGGEMVVAGVGSLQGAWAAAAATGAATECNGGARDVISVAGAVGIKSARSNGDWSLRFAIVFSRLRGGGCGRRMGIGADVLVVVVVVVVVVLVLLVGFFHEGLFQGAPMEEATGVNLLLLSLVVVVVVLLLALPL
eukprot:evm.model.NODE_13674_length_13341_cov_22.742823.3